MKYENKYVCTILEVGSNGLRGLSILTLLNLIFCLYPADDEDFLFDAREPVSPQPPIKTIFVFNSINVEQPKQAMFAVAAAKPQEPALEIQSPALKVQLPLANEIVSYQRFGRANAKILANPSFKCHLCGFSCRFKETLLQHFDKAHPQ